MYLTIAPKTGVVKPIKMDNVIVNDKANIIKLIFFLKFCLSKNINDKINKTVNKIFSITAGITIIEWISKIEGRKKVFTSAFGIFEIKLIKLTSRSGKLILLPTFSDELIILMKSCCLKLIISVKL